MITIGYDGSLDAREAVRQAGTLMPGHPALIITIWGSSERVISPLAPVGDSPSTDRMARERAQRCAEEGARVGHAAWIDCTARACVQEGTVADTLVAEARRLGSRAIIIGRGGGARPGVGEVSQAVLQSARCPVLIVDGAADSDRPPGTPEPPRAAALA